MSNLDHIILFLFLFLFVPLWGKYNCNKKGSEFWFSATFPILLASIIIGCRYWGADYLWYKYQFEHLNNIAVIEEQRSQPVFFGLNHLINWLGLNYVGAYIIYSFIYFIGVFQLFKSYKKESKYMYWFLVFCIYRIWNQHHPTRYFHWHSDVFYSFLRTKEICKI